MADQSLPVGFRPEDVEMIAYEAAMMDNVSVDEMLDSLVGMVRTLRDDGTGAWGETVLRAQLRGTMRAYVRRTSPSSFTDQLADGGAIAAVRRIMDDRR